MTSMALLACVGVDEEGFREVLVIEVAGSEKGATYASLLRGLLDCGLKGVKLVVSDDQDAFSLRHRHHLLRSEILEALRAQVTERGVEPPSVVERLQVLENGTSRGLPGRTTAAMNSWSMRWRWRCGGEDLLRDYSSLIRTGAPSTLRSPSAKGSKGRASCLQ